MKAELDLPKVPQGWTYDGFREITKGEKYFDGRHWADWTGEPSDFLAFVLRTTWRPATAADVGKPCRCANNGKAYEGKLVHVYDRMETPYLCVINNWHTTFQSCELQETGVQEAEKPPIEVQQAAKYMKVLRRYEHDYWDDEGRRYCWGSPMNKYIGGVYEVQPGNLCVKIDGLVFPREALQKVEVFPIDNQEGLWYFLSNDDVTRVGDLQYSRGKWVFPAFDCQVDSSVIVRRVK